MTATEDDPGGIAAIAAALTATRRFGTVRTALAGDPAPPADQLPAALVAAGPTEDQDLTDPVLLLRKHSFTLRIVVRDEDPERRRRLLTGLDYGARRAILNAALGPDCLPALTRIARSRPDPAARAPEAALVLEGEYTTLPGDGA
jgi:hypothetical protein